MNTFLNKSTLCFPPFIACVQVRTSESRSILFVFIILMKDDEVVLVFLGYVLPAEGAAAARSSRHQFHLPDESPAAVRHPSAGGGSAPRCWSGGTSG